MATIGHSSPVAALRYQHSSAERSRLSPTIPTEPSMCPTAAGAENDAVPQTAGGAWHGVKQRQSPEGEQTRASRRTTTKRRRAESNRRTGLCSGRSVVRNGSHVHRLPVQSACGFGTIQPDSWLMRHHSVMDGGSGNSLRKDYSNSETLGSNGRGLPARPRSS